jgi:hypothetical protein
LKFIYLGLTQEKYEKIIALQQKHDAEIILLANECQLEIGFVKVFIINYGL